LEPLAKEGASFEFTQPIELRFNELLTGAKADVTVNMYGEDLQKLADLGEEASQMIRPIPGAADVKLDRTEGFPQIVASYRRDRLALYGLNVADINQALNTAFSGGIAGTVFEGEKRFDLVLRFQEMNRKHIEDIRQLPLRLPGGGQIPLSELADIRYEEGPMLISRENTRRKITIGINVRNRDVESLVQEIQETLDRKLKLPAGYSLSYGGEFENLQSARTRLSVAVPIALFLIFALLFLTFNNMRQVLMIFSAIPLAAIGGIFALLLRGMPFSISAAIGFIALFGVAVLNGIVLIAFFNQLKEAGFTDVRERILEGTRIRLRPVLMTASVASLGFLPMAISGSAGAEVQRPLATVVIGGLITATFLTLIMLPVMYSLFGEKKVKTPPQTPPSPPAAPIVATLLLLMLCMPLAQGQTLSLKAAEEKALAENPGIQALRTNVRAAQVHVKTAIQLPMTTIEWQQGQINSLTRDQLWTLRQDFGQPLAWGAARSVKEAEVKLAEAQLRKAEHLLLSTVRSHYSDWLLPRAKIMLLREMDSLYRRFGEAARTRYESGEGSKLEWLSARQQMAALSMEIRRFEAEEVSALGYLRQILGDSMLPVYEALDIQTLDKQGDSLRLTGHPLLAEYESQWQKQQAEARLQQRLISPGLSVGYFTQSLEKVSGFNGVLVGVSLPLWFVPRRAEVLSARLRTEESLSLWEYEQQRMKQEYLLRQAQVAESRGRYAYYQEQALPQADEIARIAQAAYQAGELDYLGLLIHLNETLRIRLAALDAWHDHQKALFRLQELSY
ncbi:MAG: CusA/CzcA family heavy metal efflux RND transporter, partial [Bacteroidetes bacterium]